jgi:hypothetical protein
MLCHIWIFVEFDWFCFQTIHGPIEVTVDYDNYEERIAEAAKGKSSIIINLSMPT